MTFNLWMHYWLLAPIPWVVCGLILMGLEFFDGSFIFFVPFGMASLINGGILYGQENGLLGSMLLLTSWGDSLLSLTLVGAVLAVALRFFLRKRLQNPSLPDVNQY